MKNMFDGTVSCVLFGAAIAISLYVGALVLFGTFPVLVKVLAVAMGCLFAFQFILMITNFIQRREWEALIALAFVVALIVVAHMWDNAHPIGGSGPYHPYHAYVYRLPRSH